MSDDEKVTIKGLFKNKLHLGHELVMNNAKNEMIDQHMIIVPCQMEPLEKIFHLYNLAPFVVFGPLVFCLFIIYLKIF